MIYVQLPWGKLPPSVGFTTAPAPVGVPPERTKPVDDPSVGEARFLGDLF